MSASEVVARHEALLGEGEWAGTRGAAMPTRAAGLPEIDPRAQIDVPVLCGTTRDEATFLLRTAGGDAPDEQCARVTAQLFRDPVERFARERAAAGGRVHLYRIDHASPEPRLGALHTIDVPLVFGTYDTPVGCHYVADDERTRAVSASMQRDWARFIHGVDLGWPDLQVIE
jgi:para-nitrobenzyl esterase